MATSFRTPHIRKSGSRMRQILLVESGILLKIGIQNPSSTDKDWNPAPGIQNPVWELRLSDITNVIWEVLLQETDRE